MARGAVAKITKRVVDQADLARGRHCVWDSELKGFGVQIEPTGTRTYFVRYRPQGHGRAGVRRFYKLGRHGDITADEARRLAKTALGRVAAGADPALELAQRREAIAAAEPTFAEAVELFMREHVAPKRRAKTQELYRTLLTARALPSLGKRRLQEVTRNDLSKLHLAMRSHPASANRTLAVVSSLYSFAAARGLVPEGYNPTRRIERYREQGRERYLTSDELQRLGATLVKAETTGLPWLIDTSGPNAKHVPRTRQREVLDPYAVAAIRLLLFTGARLREILDLRWEHVDVERGLLFIADSKTGKKTIVLNGAALAVLQALASMEAAVPRAGYVIKGALAAKPRADMKKPWASIRRHAELGGVRLHDLRHTFASIGAGASLGLPIVGKLLGHSQPQTTARYAHLDTDPLRRAADIIGEHLSAALAPGSQQPAKAN